MENLLQLNPSMNRVNDLKVFMNYRRMRHINRCNTFPTLKPIDVAQHSYYVTMLAMALADEYNTWADELKLSGIEHLKLVNIEKLLRKSLLHDTEESFTSDIPWNIKHMNEEINEALTKAINERIDEAYCNTETIELYHKLGKECKQDFEGQFVAISDTLELAIYCWEEVSMSNNYLKSMLDKCIVIIESYSISHVLRQSSPLYMTIMNMLKSESKGITTELLDIK